MPIKFILIPIHCLKNFTSLFHGAPLFLCLKLKDKSFELYFMLKKQSLYFIQKTLLRFRSFKMFGT
jgi:hypothetical protein